MYFSNNIIGNGFIGKNLRKIKKDIIKSNYIIYAAGISNSKIKSKKELKREFSLLKSYSKKNSSKKFIYISTADTLDSLKKRNEYVKNKIKIENFIKKKFIYHIILRLPQIIGKSKNKNTLINYFYYNIKNKKKFTLFKNIKRNILDIEDVLKVIKYLLKLKLKNQTITLSNKYCEEPSNIVEIFEKKLKRKAIFKIIKSKKQIWKLNYKKNSRYLRPIRIRFNRNYLLKAINKYY